MASGYSYERVHTALRSLERKGVLGSMRVGNALIYQLSMWRDEALLAFVMRETERTMRFGKKHVNVFNAISRFLGTVECDAAVIFGSYAKGTERATSDVDILFISNDDMLSKKAVKLHFDLDKSVSAVVVPKKDFWEIRRDNAPFLQDLIEFGIVVKGYETMFELVYRWNIWSKRTSDGTFGSGYCKGPPSFQGSPRSTWKRQSITGTR